MTKLKALAGLALFVLIATAVLTLPDRFAQAQSSKGSRGSVVGSGLFLSTGGISVAIAGPAQNATKLWGFVPLQTVTFTTIGYAIVTTADNTANLYDLGILDSSGNIVAHIGATAGTTFSPSTGSKNLALLAPATIYAGQKYYIAWTTNAAATPANLGGISNSSFLVGGAGATTSGGALSAGTPPADQYSGGNYPGITLHN